MGEIIVSKSDRATLIKDMRASLVYATRLRKQITESEDINSILSNYKGLKSKYINSIDSFITQSEEVVLTLLITAGSDTKSARIALDLMLNDFPEFLNFHFNTTMNTIREE